MSVLGLSLIFSTVVFFSKETPTPSSYTLLPTVGTAMVIIYASSATVVGRILGNKILSSIGLISYSLYLWHQPVLTYGKKYFGQITGGYTVVILLFITFLLSYASWALVETKARSITKVSRTHFFFWVSSAACGLIIVASLGHLNNGFPQRNEFTRKLSNNTGYGLHCSGNTWINPKCTSNLTPRVAAVGNSYMMHFIDPLSKHYGHGVVQLTQSRCKLGFKDPSISIAGTQCPDFYEAVLQTINESTEIKIVYLSSPFREVNGSRYRRSFIRFLEKLSDYEVVILGPTPTVVA